MKKAIAILAVIGLLLVPAALAEENADLSSLTGDWYADLSGMSIQMTLEENGSYELLFPGEEAVGGTWEEQDGYLCLDGELPPEVTVLGDTLQWTDTMVFFTREPVETYTPAEVAAEGSEGLYTGYWQCAYVDRNGTAVPALAAQDRTDLYVEGTSAILGGPSFGDTLVRMAYEDGAMVCEADGASVRMEIQEDCMLRLTVSGEGKTQTWYMTPAYSPLFEEDVDTETDST